MKKREEYFNKDDKLIAVAWELPFDEDVPVGLDMLLCEAPGLVTFVLSDGLLVTFLITDPQYIPLKNIKRIYGQTTTVPQGSVVGYDVLQHPPRHPAADKP